MANASHLPPVTICIVRTSYRLNLFKTEEFSEGVGTTIRTPCGYKKAKEYADHWVDAYRSQGRRVSLEDDRAREAVRS